MESRAWVTVLLVVVGVVVLVPVLGTFVWHAGPMMMGQMPNGPMMGQTPTGSMMGGGMMRWYAFGAFGLLPLLLVIAAAVAIGLALTRVVPGGEQPLHVLKRRLATGDITPEQYTELKQALQ